MAKRSILGLDNSMAPSEDWMSEYLNSTAPAVESSAPPADTMDVAYAMSPPEEGPSVLPDWVFDDDIPKNFKPGVGSQKKTDKKRSMDQRKSTTKAIYKDEDTAREQFDLVKELLGYDEVDPSDDLLAMQSEKAREAAGSPMSWIAPGLLALTDAQTGSQFSKQYESPIDRYSDIMKMQSESGKRKKDMNKAILEGVKSLKEGSQTDALSQQLLSNMGFIQGQLSAGAGRGLSIGETAVDKEFAKEYTDFVLRGGYAEVQRNLKTMDDIVNSLNNQSNLTGPNVGLMPKGVRDITNPESADVQDRYEQVVQASLKRILGAQFTEKEAIRLIERSFNPRLSQEKNAQRIRGVQRELKQAAEAKAAASRYFERTGSMKGYEGAGRISIGGKTFDINEKLFQSLPEETEEKTKPTGKKVSKRDEELTEAELDAEIAALKKGG